MMGWTTALGALIGGAIDGADGDDSSWDGALKGAVAATAIRIVLPIALTYATGWLVLKGVNELKSLAFGDTEGTKA